MLQRTRSVSSDNGFNRAGSERGSYRAPKGTSRYMQAAEAYKYKTVNSTSGLNSTASGLNNSGGSSASHNNSTWSTSSKRSRARPSLTPDTFTPRPIRTASASPAVTRKRLNSGTRDPVVSPTHHVTSTHSTPVKRPGQGRDLNRSHSRDFGLPRSHSRDHADVETDEMILKRMEEILFTYKTKVEDRLAAEGKELPKDIFQDFTEHWINSSPYRAKSVDSLNSSEKSVDRTPTLPKTRKDTKEGCPTTKIPIPTFYKNSIS